MDNKNVMIYNHKSNLKINSNTPLSTQAKVECHHHIDFWKCYYIMQHNSKLKILEAA